MQKYEYIRFMRLKRLLLLALLAATNSLAVYRLLGTILERRCDKVLLRNSSSPLVLSTCNGRLGNQLSAAATVLALADRFDGVPVLDRRQLDVLAAVFGQSIDKNFRVADGTFSGRSGGGLCALFWTFEPDVQKLILKRPRELVGEVVNIGAYPNEVSLFKQQLAKLSTVFRPKQAFLERARATMDNATKHLDVADDPVCVHVRGGDYGRHLRTVEGMGTAGEEYYKGAMAHFATKSKRLPLFLVLSSDPDEAEKLLTTSNASICHHSNHPINCVFISKKGSETSVLAAAAEDLSLLSQCRRLVLSHGTFGLWGAVLATANSQHKGDRAVEVIMPGGAHATTHEARKIRRAHFPGWTFL